MTKLKIQKSSPRPDVHRDTPLHFMERGIKGVRWILFALCILIFGFPFPAQALDNPEEKISRVIENYVISKYPDWAALKIRVGFESANRTFEKLREAEGEVNFKIAEIYADFKPAGNVIFPIEVLEGGVSKKIFVRTRVEVLKEIAVAEKTIKRGEKIKAGDLALEERDIAMLPQKYFEDLNMVLNSEAKINIPKKSTVFEWMIREVPLVRRGDEVPILVKGPSLLVKTKGIALMDGYRDKKIKVKRMDSKKTLEGILISSDEVEVMVK